MTSARRDRATQMRERRKGQGVSRVSSQIERALSRVHPEFVPPLLLLLLVLSETRQRCGSSEFVERSPLIIVVNTRQQRPSRVRKRGTACEDSCATRRRQNSNMAAVTSRWRRCRAYACPTWYTPPSRRYAADRRPVVSGRFRAVRRAA